MYDASLWLCAMCVQANADQLLERVTGITWSGRELRAIQLSDWAGPPLSGTAACARLRLLQGVSYDTASPLIAVSVSLAAIMTDTVLSALQALPRVTLGGCLDLAGCTWPLEPAAYRQLASHVPKGYFVWHLDLAPDSEVLKCIKEGLGGRVVQFRQ